MSSDNEILLHFGGLDKNSLNQYYLRMLIMKVMLIMNLRLSKSHPITAMLISLKNSKIKKIHSKY